MKFLALTTAALMATAVVAAAPLPEAEVNTQPVDLYKIDFAPPNITPHIGQESQDGLSNRAPVQKRDIAHLTKRGWMSGLNSMTSHGAAKWKVLNYNTFGKPLIDTMVKAWKQNNNYGGHTIHVDADSRVLVEWNMPQLTGLTENAVRQLTQSVIDTQRQFQWQTAEFLWTTPTYFHDDGNRAETVGTMSIHRV
ncbi:hypothetical protein BG003_004658 [Podila horticola]|nr:hypothetical protein BG003_004658 [Podila horticola]